MNEICGKLLRLTLQTRNGKTPISLFYVVQPGDINGWREGAERESLVELTVEERKGGVVVTRFTVLSAQESYVPQLFKKGYVARILDVGNLEC